MKITKRYVFLAVCAAIMALTALILLPSVYASAEDDDGAAYPPSCFIADTGNRIDLQEGDRCSAYAAAYVLRSQGKEISGDDLYPEMKRIFGFVPPASVAKVLTNHGCDARAYHGNVDTLKARVSEGNPVIVFIRVPHDTHYAVVTGYDEEYIYLADSTAENANADEALYNRRVTTSEFKKLWRTVSLVPADTYIAVDD